MKVSLSLALLLAAAVPGMAGTTGSFRGTVVQGPVQTDVMYVEGRNHSIRRVYVNGAEVHYDSDVPARQRQKPIPMVLPVGTQVRVTAEQDDGGEWRATEIEILRPEPQQPEEKKPAAPTTSQS